MGCVLLSYDWEVTLSCGVEDKKLSLYIKYITILYLSKHSTHLISLMLNPST